MSLADSENKSTTPFSAIDIARLCKSTLQIFPRKEKSVERCLSQDTSFVPENLSSNRIPRTASRLRICIRFRSSCLASHYRAGSNRILIASRGLDGQSVPPRLLQTIQCGGLTSRQTHILYEQFAFETQDAFSVVIDGGPYIDCCVVREPQKSS